MIIVMRQRSKQQLIPLISLHKYLYSAKVHAVVKVNEVVYSILRFDFRLGRILDVASGNVVFYIYTHLFRTWQRQKWHKMIIKMTETKHQNNTYGWAAETEQLNAARSRSIRQFGDGLNDKDCPSIPTHSVSFYLSLKRIIWLKRRSMALEIVSYRKSRMKQYHGLC